ncbi:Microfibril-associated glycoprotein 4 [Scophthalmus maximus]|uniref:Microfibril-associated glycoprotein 4 n=1 Tax=Scophthalmus maximus TaxID=52904 RepID=A0A2U9C5D7_SCOMX|nr:Microfibril-associated glycoprotein 4 [Scophthalmus maximus]
MRVISVILLLWAPVLISSKQPQDCREVQTINSHAVNGVYTIFPAGDRSGVKVYCDMESEGGGWTAFHRRMDGTVNFYRPWDQYKIGFGEASGEHWLGLDNLHYLTGERKHELLVSMEDFEGNKRFALYSTFSVGSECEGFNLSVSGFKAGDAGDAMSSHNGMKFSTLDRDQDTWPEHCARKFLGAFWYTACHETNPTGVYRWGADNSLFAVGMSWLHWKGHDYSLKSMSMKRIDTKFPQKSDDEGDAMSLNNGMKFSTLDRDQDTWPEHCARKFLGAFWYAACHETNPTGVYRWGADNSLFAVGMSWLHWKGHDYSLKSMSMKKRYYRFLGTKESSYGGCGDTGNGVCSADGRDGIMARRRLQRGGESEDGSLLARRTVQAQRDDSAESNYRSLNSAGEGWSEAPDNSVQQDVANMETHTEVGSNPCNYI